jgi:hypothetical protein
MFPKLATFDKEFVSRTKDIIETVKTEYDFTLLVNSMVAVTQRCLAPSAFT